MLEVTHQGTSFMKETKINILVQQYEMFKMHSNETFTQMFARFNTITNDLYALGKSYMHLNRIGKEDSKKFAQSISKQGGGNSGSKKSLQTPS